MWETIDGAWFREYFAFMRGRTRRLGAVAASKLLLPMPVASLRAAERHPGFQVQTEPGCVYPFADGRRVKYYFSNAGGVWSAQKKIDINQGAGDWTRLMGPGNTGGGGVTEVFRPEEIPVPGSPTNDMVKLVLGNVATAGTDCSVWPHLITFNTISSGQELRYLAAHEFGHVYGLRHSGATDALTQSNGILDPGIVPIMSGCVRPSDSTYDRPKSDDWDNVWFKASGTQSALGDGGFESSTVSNFSQVGAVTRDANARYAGSRSARITNVGSIEHRVRLTLPKSNLSLSVAYKHNSTATTFKGKARALGYPTGGACYYDYPVATSGWVTIYNAALNQNSNWSVLTTPLSGGWNQIPAIDVNVYIANDAAAGSILWVDNLRMRNT